MTSKVYNIEGNIDFFGELYKSLDIDDNLDDEKLCLITNELLTDNFIKLECGHKFNYIPLYNDIKNHKLKFNSLEGNTGQLKINEIRCPYCRNKQVGLLTYYEELCLPQIHGVNYIDPNIKKSVNTYTNHSSPHYSPCQYLTPNPHYDPSGNDPTEFNSNNMGNCKFFKCCNYSHYKISKYIENYNGEDIIVCYSHKTKMVKDNKIMIKNKEKEDAKNAKLELKIKEKEDKIKAKEEAKIKAKADKPATKKKVKITIKNIVLSQTINIEVPVNPTHNECIEIIKSGQNKGKQCGCKVYDGSYCKKHIKKTYTQASSKNQDSETKSEI